MFLFCSIESVRLRAAADTWSGLSVGQAAATVEGPHHPAGPNEAAHGLAAQRLERRPPGRQRERIITPDQGEPRRRRDDRADVDAVDARAVAGNVACAKLARQACGQSLGLLLPQLLHHAGFGVKPAGDGTGFCQLTLLEPAQARRERTAKLGSKASGLRVGAPVTEQRLGEPGGT